MDTSWARAASRAAFRRRLRDARGAITRSLALAVILGAAIGLSACLAQETSPRLPALGAAPDDVTVSGISAGAYMAAQMQFAHASRISGAGLVAGGPYGCAESLMAPTMPGPGATLVNLTKAINGCMHNAMQFLGEPNVDRLAEQARRRAESGANDPIADLVSDRVYLFSGAEDRTVLPAIVEAAANLYRRLGVPDDQIRFRTDIAAGHAFVTMDSGVACGETAAPYLTDCDYDQAGAILNHLLGELAPAQPQAATSENGDVIPDLIVFDQTEFTDDLDQHGFAEQGYVYVPPACQDTSGCRVHVVFHGCRQAAEIVGRTFIHQVGYNRWAEANRLVVLYPQIRTTAVNPQGCWDWWGYTGRDYLTKAAPQIVVIERMLDRLGELEETGPRGRRSAS